MARYLLNSLERCGCGVVLGGEANLIQQHVHNAPGALVIDVQVFGSGRAGKNGNPG